MTYPSDSVDKESAFIAGDAGLIPGLGRSLGEGKGYPLQYSGLENSMDCIVHGGHKELDVTELLNNTQQCIRNHTFVFSIYKYRCNDTWYS